MAAANELEREFQNAVNPSRCILGRLLDLEVRPDMPTDSTRSNEGSVIGRHREPQPRIRQGEGPTLSKDFQRVSRLLAD